MPTLKLVAGANHGSTVSLVTGNAGNRYCDSVVGTPAIVTGGRTGTYCFEISSSAATEAITWDTNSLGTLTGRMVFGGALYFPTSLPAGNVQLLFALSTDASDDVALTYRSSDQKLVLQKGGIAGGTTLAVSASAVAANTWYWIDLDLNVGATTWTGDMKVDNVSAVGQFTQTGKTSQSFSALNLGSPQTAQTATFRWDDIVVSITAADFPLGDHHVELLKPDTAATATEIGTANATARFTANGTLDTTFNSANILAALSEVPPTIGATASGIHQRTAAATNAAEIPLTTYTLQSGESISGVRVVTLGWAASTVAAFMGLRTFNGTTETILQAGTVDPNFDNSTTAPAWLCKMATAADFDTQTELNAMTLRLGYSTDVNPVIGYHWVGAEVAIKSSAGTPPASVNLSPLTFDLGLGTVQPIPIVALSPLTFNLSLGSVVGTPSVALSPLTFPLSLGTVVGTPSVPLSPLTFALGLGTMSPTIPQIVALSPLTFTLGLGSVQPTPIVPLSPLTFALGLGTVSARPSVGLSPITFNLSQGTVVGTPSVPLSPLTFLLSLGTVSGRPSVGLSPLTFTMGLGSVSGRPSVGLSPISFALALGAVSPQGVTPGAVALAPITFNFDLGSIRPSQYVGLSPITFDVGLGAVSARPSVALSPLTFPLTLGSVQARPSVSLNPLTFALALGSVVGRPSVALTPTTFTLGLGSVLPAGQAIVQVSPITFDLGLGVLSPSDASIARPTVQLAPIAFLVKVRALRPRAIPIEYEFVVTVDHAPERMFVDTWTPSVGPALLLTLGSHAREADLEPQRVTVDRGEETVRLEAP